MNRAKYIRYICECFWRDAVHVPFRETRGWLPKVSGCHANVAIFITENPNHTAVRGWVSYGGNEAMVMLTAHAVVRGPDGELFDITPLENEHYRKGMKFVQHCGEHAAFDEMVNRKQIFITCETRETEMTKHPLEMATEEINAVYGKARAQPAVVYVFGLGANQNHDRITIDLVNERDERWSLPITQEALRVLLTMAEKELKGPSRPKVN